MGCGKVWDRATYKPFFPSDSKKVKLNKKGWKEKKESKKGKIKVESEEKG